jgi:hypothetical protein
VRPELGELKAAITAVVTLLVDETATLSLEEVEAIRADIDRFRAELWYWGKRHGVV